MGGGKEMSVWTEFCLWGVSLLPNFVTLEGLFWGGNFKINFCGAA
jgi:hypothetical protein